MPFVPLQQGDETPPAEPSTPRQGFTPLAVEEPARPAQGFTPLQAPQEGVARRAWRQLGRPETLRNILLNNPATAAVETGLNLASQSIAVPVSGLAGIGTELARAVGATDAYGGDVVHAVGDALTYQPRGEAGKAVTRVITYPFEKLAEGGRYLGDKTLEASGSPVAATVVDTAVNSLPMLIPGAYKGAKAKLAAPPATPPRVAELQAQSRAVAAEAAAAEPGFVPLGRGAGVERHPVPARASPDGVALPDAAGAAVAAMEAEPGRAARYALMESDDVRASHTRDMRETEGYPVNFRRPDWERAQAEQRVQSIVRDFDPQRLIEAVDDADGAPVVSADGVVEAGNARAVALQRIYRADGANAAGYRQALMERASDLGLDPAVVAEMRKPVLVRLPDEPAVREVAPAVAAAEEGGTAMPRDGRVNAWAPGENYVGFIDDSPGAAGAGAGAPGLPGTPGVASAGRPRAEPLRREDILVPFLQALDTSLYEGRVKGKNTLGFFRPGTGEVRIKRHADLETSAHELAHHLDNRVPEIRKSWSEGPGWQARREELRSLSYDSGKVYEGFAEFVRHYMTQPEVARTRAPEFSKWFDAFTADHALGPAIRKAQEGMGEWFGQTALDRARSKIGGHRPLSDAMDGRWDAFRQASVDDLHGVYRMERELSGGKIAPAGPYESARLSRAAASIADGALRYGAPVLKKDGSFGWKGRGLEDILRQVPADKLDDALLYFVGRSSRELMGQGREHLFTPGEVDAMLQLRTPEAEKAFREYQQWNKDVLDFAEAHGVINPDARRAWQRTQYLPFHRVGQAGGHRAKPGDWSGVKALTGGTENLRDVLGNMTANAALLIEKAVKNEARQKIATMAEGAGGGKFMARIPAEARPIKVNKQSVIDAMAKAMGVEKGDANAAAVAAQLREMLGDSPAMLDLMQQNMPPAGGNVVAVLKDGKPVWYEVADPILLRALESIDRQPPPWIVQWLALPKRIGQTTITLTPDFMVANMARDTIMGSVMSRAGFRPVVDSLRGMRLRLTNDQVYKDFVANGGGLSSIFLDEHKFRARLQRFYGRNGIDYRTVLDAPSKLLNFVETLADAFETSTRLGEFKRAVDAGENPRHAAYLAREVSSDFAMRGDSKALGFLTDVTMFLRPALTSWDRLARGLAHDPNRGAIATRAGMLALMSAGLYLLNRDDPRYQDLPDWDRDTHWHFFVGDQHFRYPKIWELGALSSAAERTVEKIMDDDPQGLGKDFARILGATFNVNLTPQIVAPLVEQATNRSGFTGAPLETPGMEKLQPFLRAKPGTSETMRGLGMATADLPESLQVNPVRAEALLRGYFNTWAMYGLMLTDEAIAGDKKPELRTDQLPVVRRFYSQEPPLSTRYETMYYDMLGEARRLQGTLRELDKLERPDLADEKEASSRLTGQAKPLEHAGENLQAINRDMRQVRRDSTLTPAQKRSRLDDLQRERNDLLKRTVQDTQTSLKENAR